MTWTVGSGNGYRQSVQDTQHYLRLQNYLFSGNSEPLKHCGSVSWGVFILFFLGIFLLAWLYCGSCTWLLLLSAAILVRFPTKTFHFFHIEDDRILDLLPFGRHIIKQVLQNYKTAVLRIRDPVPFWPLDPGSRIGFFRISDPESLTQWELSDNLSRLFRSKTEEQAKLTKCCGFLSLEKSKILIL